MNRILAVLVLTVLIHLISTLSYSVRMAGVRTKRLLTAFSLYNIIYLLVSISNNIQIPLLTSVVEHSIREGIIQQTDAFIPIEQIISSETYSMQLVLLEGKIRLIIFAATIGTVIGACLIPSFLHFFIKAINYYEETGSASKTFWKLSLSLLQRRTMSKWQLLLFRPYLLKQLAGQKITIPGKFLLANIIVTGFYINGILSALYAGAMFPEFRTTANTLAAVINGIATVLGAVVVEPVASSITDEALCGKRNESDVKQMVIYLTITRIMGTILAQLIFIPAADFIKLIVQKLA